MADIMLGVLAIIAGGAMLVAGQFVLRLVIPIWSFFAGFAFGAGIVAEFADEHFLGTVLGWALGLLFAVIFAVLALGIVIQIRQRVVLRQSIQETWYAESR